MMYAHTSVTAMCRSLNMMIHWPSQWLWVSSSQMSATT